jgi:hypothetical protein
MFSVIEWLRDILFNATIFVFLSSVIYVVSNKIWQTFCPPEYYLNLCRNFPVSAVGGPTEKYNQEMS